MTSKLLHRLIVRPVVMALPWAQAEERKVLLVAIAIQESALKHRIQQPNGPALSWWQIETPTCVDCLDRCSAAQRLWVQFGLTYRFGGIERVELQFNDLGACAVAAGILRLTPGKLPDVGDEEAAWKYYLKAWRPGKPRPGSWHKAYTAAMDERDAN